MKMMIIQNIEDIINKSNGSIAFNIILKENITNPEKLKEMSTKLGTDVKMQMMQLII